MARSIGVYLCEGEDAIFDESLGSEAAVRELWSEPAARLGLPLIAAIYEPGFCHGTRWGGAELDQVLHELRRLERNSPSAGLPPEEIANLIERAGFLHAGIALAKQRDGFVLII